MKERHHVTIIGVTDEKSARMGAEVRSILPKASKPHRRQKITPDLVCRGCGGPKTQQAAECAACHRRAMSRSAAAARRAGYRSLGRSTTSKADTIYKHALMTQPPEDERSVRFGHHTRSVGTPRTPPRLREQGAIPRLEMRAERAARASQRPEEIHDQWCIWGFPAHADCVNGKPCRLPFNGGGYRGVGKILHECHHPIHKRGRPMHEPRR